MPEPVFMKAISALYFINVAKIVLKAVFYIMGERERRRKLGGVVRETTVLEGGVIET
jgi:hypothetical protein